MLRACVITRVPIWLKITPSMLALLACSALLPSALVVTPGSLHATVHSGLHRASTPLAQFTNPFNSPKKEPAAKPAKPAKKNAFLEQFSPDYSEAQRKERLETGTNWVPRTSTVKGEG